MIKIELNPGSSMLRQSLGSRNRSKVRESSFDAILKRLQIGSATAALYVAHFLGGLLHAGPHATKGVLSWIVHAPRNTAAAPFERRSSQDCTGSSGRRFPKRIFNVFEGRVCYVGLIFFLSFWGPSGALGT